MGCKPAAEAASRDGPAPNARSSPQWCITSLENVSIRETSMIQVCVCDQDFQYYLSFDIPNLRASPLVLNTQNKTVSWFWLVPSSSSRSSWATTCTRGVHAGEGPLPGASHLSDPTYESIHFPDRKVLAAETVSFSCTRQPRVLRRAGKQVTDICQLNGYSFHAYLWWMRPSIIKHTSEVYFPRPLFLSQVLDGKDDWRVILPRIL